MRVWRFCEDRVNSPLTKETEGADSPDQPNCEESKTQVNDVLKWTIRIWNMEEFSAAVEHRPQIYINWLTYTRQHMWICHTELSSASPVADFHGDTGYLGITTIHTSGVQQCEQTLRKAQTPVQVRAEIFPADPEEVPVKLSNWELSPVSAQPPFPNSISIHSFSCPFSLSWLFHHRLKELVPVISMLMESCSVPEQPRAELWAKQRGKSSTTRGIRGGGFGGSEERRMPCANCNLGHSVAEEGENTKPQMAGEQCLARAWEIQLRKIWS